MKFVYSKRDKSGEYCYRENIQTIKSCFGFLFKYYRVFLRKIAKKYFNENGNELEDDIELYMK